MISFERTKVDDQQYRVVVNYTLADGAVNMQIRYSIFSNGFIRVENSAEMKDDIDLPMLPKYGMQVQLSKALDDLQWYGRGPHENYSDRNLGAAIGRYKESVSKDYYHYIRPQESSNKTDVEWLTLTDKKGKGVYIAGIATGLSISAWPYATEDIDAALHTYNLKQLDFITLNIDLIQMGVGGDDSWSMNALPHQEFRVYPRNYQYSFVLAPIEDINIKQRLALPSSSARSE